ncbi:MAG: hypothetical protein GXO29_02270 [Thermotogae bacterium]|nr:hypothetical protein [Thermotogota bacterium]
MDVIDRYVFSGDVHGALRIAARRFRQDGDVRAFETLINVLTTMRRIRSIRRLLRRFAGNYPNSEVLGVPVHLRMLRIDRLLKIFPRLTPTQRVWVHAILGEVHKAKETVETYNVEGFAREYVRILMGERPSLPPKLPYRMSLLYRDHLKALYYAVSGLTDESVRLLESITEESLRRGFLGWGIDASLLRGLLEGDPSRIALAGGLARELGDLLSLKLSEIYLLPFTGVEPTLPSVPRFSIQMRHARAVRNGERITRLPGEPFGYYALWWYVSKRVNRETYLSFAGRLRLMGGDREVRVQRWRRSNIVLAFHKIFGRGGIRYARIIFPESPSPERRYKEYLSRLGEIQNVPTDAFITLRYGTFLSDEEGTWAQFLKDNVKA